jgi:hypothetical protein
MRRGFGVGPEGTSVLSEKVCITLDIQVVRQP